jgi:hypothetical protein
MRIEMKFIITISTIGFWVMAAGTVVAQSPAPVTLPPALVSCLRTELSNQQLYGKMAIEKTLHFADTRFENKTYYLVGIFPEGSQYSMQMIISVDADNRCQVPFFNEHGDEISFSPSVPKAVAQALALQMVRKALVEHGGLSNYQKYLINVARQNGNRIELTPELWWAMNQFGVRLPSDIKITGLPR